MYSEKITLEAIANIVNQHDPVGLLATGAPQNEYDIEIKILFDTISQNSTESLLVPGDLQQTVLTIFSTEFGSAIVNKCLPRYEAIARDLLEMLNQKIKSHDSMGE
jgi:hypothetical protein